MEHDRKPVTRYANRTLTKVNSSKTPNIQRAISIAKVMVNYVMPLKIAPVVLSKCATTYTTIIISPKLPEE